MREPSAAARRLAKDFSRQDIHPPAREAFAIYQVTNLSALPRAEVQFVI
jgi:hypothetical protein